MGGQIAFYLTPLQLGTKEYYIKYNHKCTNACYVFSFIHNFKLKTEVIIDYKYLLVPELPFHVAEFLFQKLQYI